MRKIRRRINENTGRINRLVTSDRLKAHTDLNPVMSDAILDDMESEEEINRRLKEFDKIPERHKPFLGAKNQPIPEKPIFESKRNRFRKRKINESNINHWTDAYKEFEKIVDKYWPNSDEIESKVYDLAMSHYGEAIWDKAYDKWLENCNDEELQEEFNAGNFYGIKGIKMIDHGVNRDPEIQYKGKRYNYYMIEDSLWDMCRNECKENDIPFNEDVFSKWVRNNPDIVKELLDNSIRESRRNRFNRKSINEADIKDFSNKEDKAQKEQNADYWNRVYQELCPDDPHWADGRYAVRTIYKNINPRKRFKSDDLRLDIEDNIIYIKDSVKPELVNFAKQVADDYERYMVYGKKNGVQEDELFGIIMPDEDEEMSDELVTKINTIYKDWENI